MKQIKEGTYKNTKCNWCLEQAEWRSGGLGLNKYACNAHRKELALSERTHSGDMSEADHQTWGKL